MRATKLTTWCIGMAFLVAVGTGCATTEPETVPLASIADYDETPDHLRDESPAATEQAQKNSSAECQALRKSIENWQTAYTASIGLGALGFATGVAGLLTDNETAQKIGGALGAIGTLSQATTATGTEIQEKKASERECFVE